jgi:hypothetical protein
MNTKSHMGVVSMSAIEDRRSDRSRTSKETRRRYPRVRIPFEGFYDSTDRMLMIRGGNINLRGLFVPTTSPDQLETEAIVRILLPKNEAMMKVPARVVWANEDPEAGPLGMGLRFDALLPWQLKRIAAALIREGGFEVFPEIARAGLN